MDETRVNQVIQYALAIAGGGEFGERELGPIHLIKYVYLGDLAYSERNEGETFTSVAWRFYHYGPWDAGVFERIEPAAEAVHAERRTFDYGGDQDGVRFQVRSNELIEKMELELPHVVVSAVKKAVREFHADTYDLLDFVYRTGPMTKAAPGDYLDFSPPPPTAAREPQAQYTARQLKKRRTQLRAVRDQIQEQLKRDIEKRKAKQQELPQPAPRYDEVFANGQRWLDSLAGPRISPEGELVFSDEVWKSNGRGDPDIS